MSAVNPQDLFNYLTKIGATRNEATMLSAAAGVESGYVPTATHDKDENGNPTGYGLWGHRLDRRDAMFKFAGTSAPNWQQQAAYALSDLRNRPESALVNQAKTPKDLTIAQMYYERPQGFSADAPQNGLNYSKRLALTQNISGGNFSAPAAGGATVDPTNPIDQSAHDAWAKIFGDDAVKQKQLQAGAQPAAAAPKLDTNGSAFGALASGAMQGAGNGQPALIPRLLLGDKAGSGVNGLLGAIPTPNNGAGLLGGMFGSTPAASVAPAASAGGTPGFTPSAGLVTQQPTAAAPAPSVSPAVDPSAAGSPLARTPLAGTPLANSKGLAALQSLFGGATGAGGAGLGGAISSGVSSGLSSLGSLFGMI